MDETTTVGMDLAKAVIVLCGANREGRAVYFRQFSLRGFAEWAVRLAPCRFGLEARSSAHYWRRQLKSRGYAPQLMADWVTCPSASTPKGKAKIEQIAARMSTAESRIKDAAAQPAPESVTPSATSTTRLVDVYA